MTHENSPVNMNHYIPNTSSIPNILFDYWMLHLTPAEFKVLMCIARKTYGWRKDFDRISITQIEKMTGLSRKGITKNLDALIEHGLITKIKSKTSDGDDAPNQYEVNVHCLKHIQKKTYNITLLLYLLICPNRHYLLKQVRRERNFLLTFLKKSNS